MRIARYRFGDSVWWGFVVAGAVAPAPPDAPGIPEALAAVPGELEALASAAGTPVSLEDVDLLAPVPDPPQFIGIARNYMGHAVEEGVPIPDAPVAFGLLNSAITDPGAPIELPKFTEEVDWEVELAIVIGRGGRDIPHEEALSAVAGYTIVNDVSARDVQLSEGQWGRAKSFDTFKPMGPWITTVNELGAADTLAVRLWVNDVLKQDANTSELIFGVRELVSRLSGSTTLRPGMVIASGTPHGVGSARHPPEYLRPGDTVTLEVEGIGRFSNPVVDSR